MSISSMFCMRMNLVTEPDTAWQGIRSCIENYAGLPLKGTFGTHYSKPISLFWLKVTLSRWLPLSVITTDCQHHVPKNVPSLLPARAACRGCLTYVSDRYCRSDTRVNTFVFSDSDCVKRDSWCTLVLKCNKNNYDWLLFHKIHPFQPGNILANWNTAHQSVIIVFITLQNQSTPSQMTMKLIILLWSL